MSHTPPPEPPADEGTVVVVEAMKMAYTELHDAYFGALAAHNLEGELGKLGITFDTDPETLDIALAEKVSKLYEDIPIHITAGAASLALVTIRTLLAKAAVANQFAAYLMENGHEQLGRYLRSLVFIPSADDESN